MTRIRTILSAVAGAVIGAHIGISPAPELLAVTAILPLLWCIAGSRLSAFALAIAYYLTAARGVPLGAATFFGDGRPNALALGVMLWCLSSVALAAPWALLWSGNKSIPPKILRLCAVSIVISIPPIGLFGWASPLLASGILFPRTSWLGIAAMTVLPPIIARATKMRNVVSVMFPCAFIIYICVQAYIMPFCVISPAGFTALNTHHAKSASGSAHFTDAFIRTTDIVDDILVQKAAYILLPETIAGAWTHASKQLWLPVGEYLAKRGQTLIVGAEIYDENLQYDNCMIFLGKDNNPIYRQRVPVPISMWRPFGGKGTAYAHWLNDGSVTLADGRIAICLLCYEQYIAWPVLFSMFHGKANILICASNLWWSNNTSIPNIQIQSSRSLAALFGLTYISATNS